MSSESNKKIMDKLFNEHIEKGLSQDKWRKRLEAAGVKDVDKALGELYSKAKEYHGWVKDEFEAGVKKSVESPDGYNLGWYDKNKYVVAEGLAMGIVTVIGISIAYAVHKGLSRWS